MSGLVQPKTPANNRARCHKVESARRTRMIGMGTTFLAALLIVVAAAAVTAQPNLVIRPDTVSSPAVPIGQTDTLSVWLINTGSETLTVSEVKATVDPTFPPRTPWLTVSTTGPLSIAPDDSSLVQAYRWGDPIYAGSDVGIPGRIRVISTTPSPRDTLYCVIYLLVSGESELPVRDTLATTCLRLSVNSIGNMGEYYAGTVNMDYFGPADCDTGANSRGDSKVYLGEGSPVIIRTPTPGDYVGSWSAFNYYDDVHAFRRAPSGASAQAFSTEYYNAFTTGTLITVDSLVSMEVTWYAPKTADSCNFIVERIRLFPATIGNAVSNLQIGLLVDFNIPSDTGETFVGNVGAWDATRQLVHQRGFNRADGVADCADNSARYGGAALLGIRLKGYWLTNTLSGGGTISNRTYIADGLRADSLYQLMQTGGFYADANIEDISTLLTFKRGFTLPANDTLTVWAALATVRTAVSRPAGLDSLKWAIEKAKNFAKNKGIGCKQNCCVGTRGNVNGTGIIDLSDLGALVSYLTGGGYVLPCFDAADINGDGRVDLIDLSCLVSYLTAGGCKPLPCPL